MVESPLLPVVGAAKFGAGQVMVVVVVQVLGVYLWVESLVFWVPFLVHSQNTFWGGGRNTYHVRPHHSSSRCALAFLLAIFVEAVRPALSHQCGAGVASLNLAQD